MKYCLTIIINVSLYVIIQLYKPPDNDKNLKKITNNVVYMT